MSRTIWHEASWTRHAKAPRDGLSVAGANPGDMPADDASPGLADSYRRYGWQPYTAQGALLLARTASSRVGRPARPRGQLRLIQPVTADSLSPCQT